MKGPLARSRGARGRMLRSLLLVTAGALATPLPAQQSAPVEAGGEATVLVLDLDDHMDDPGTARRLSELFRGELGGVLGPRLAAPDPNAGDPIYSACAFDGAAACAIDRGRRAGADLVLGGRVDDEPALVSLEMWLLEVRQGRVVRRAQARLGSEQDEWPRALRAMGVRMVAPERYVGVLEVGELQVFDRLRVDGAEVPIEVPTTQVTLAVGSHAVELERVGAEALQEVIQIEYDRVLRIPSAVAAAPSTQAAADAEQPATAAPEAHDPGESAPLPWLGFAGLGLGVAGLALGAGFLGHYLLVAQPQLDWYSEQCGGGGGDCWEQPVSDLEGAVALDLGVGAAGLVVGLGALAAGGWLVYTDLVAEEGRGEE